MAKTDDPQKIVFTWKMLLLSFASLIAVMPIVINGFYRNSQRKAIRQDKAFTTGTVTRLIRNGNGKRIWYDSYADYRVNDRVYTCVGKATIRLTKAQRDSLVGVQLPVIYEQNDPSNSYLLSSERAFNRMDANLPDSLNWTKAYFTD